MENVKRLTGLANRTRPSESYSPTSKWAKVQLPVAVNKNSLWPPYTHVVNRDCDLVELLNPCVPVQSLPFRTVTMEFIFYSYLRRAPIGKRMLKRNSQPNRTWREPRKCNAGLRTARCHAGGLNRACRGWRAWTPCDMHAIIRKRFAFYWGNIGPNENIAFN